MNQPTVLHADLVARPVHFYAELWGKDVDTLDAWCRKGWIPGAFKHGSGAWWVRPLDLIHFDPDTIQENNEQTTKSERNRNSGGRQGRLPCKKAGERTTPLRYCPKDET